MLLQSLLWVRTWENQSLHIKHLSVHGIVAINGSNSHGDSFAIDTFWEVSDMNIQVV